MHEEAPLDVAGLAAGTSVLFSAPDGSSGTETLLASLGTADDWTAVLVVTSGDARDAIDGLRERGVRSDAIGVVDASDAGITVDGVAEAQAVSDPASLSKLGIGVSDVLDRLAHRFDRVVVGLDSATTLIQAASLPATFRFLHVLAGRIRNEEAALLATLDRSAHEEEACRTVAQLFDEVLAVD